MENKRKIWIKKVLIMMLLTGLSFTLNACVVEFNGSRTGNEDQFILDVKALNREESHELYLNSEDMIEVKSQITKGEMQVSIVHEETNESIYEGNLKGDFKFIVTVHTEGTFIITVNGKNAAGYIEFKKINKE
jgi:hypothetical protein